MGRKLALTVVVTLGVALAACGTIKSVYDRGRGIFAPRHASTESPRAENNDAPEGAGHVSTASLDSHSASAAQAAQSDPTPDRHVRDVEFPVVAESVSSGVFGADMTDVFAPATVSVLAPSGMSSEQAAGFARSFRATPSGYFARMSGDDFDVVINGTRAYAVAPPSAGARSRDTSANQFSESETGLGVTFARFGADYSVDFVCRGGGNEAGMECISQQAAARFVERLIPVGGGGQ